MISLLPFSGALSTVLGLRHGVSERPGGASVGAYASLNLGRSSGDDPLAVTENGRRLREALGAESPVRFPHQVHGRAVACADEHPAAQIGQADAIVVATPGVAVGVLGADCPGVLLVDPVRRALALAHSGWRGTLEGVVPAAIDALVSRHGSRPADLVVGIGPGISQAAYEVGPEVASAFRAGFPEAAACLRTGRGDRFHLDLSAAIRLQLLRAGVRDDAIETTGLCTFSEPARFFSHRRDGAKTGRHALVAMWD